MDGLATHVFVLKLSTQRFTGSFVDKAETGVMLTRTGAQRRAARVTKRILKVPIDRIHGRIRAFRQEHYGRTVPYDDTHRRLIHVQGFASWERWAMRQIAEIERLVADEAAQLPALIADDPAVLGTLFCQDEYPTPEQFRASHSLTYTVEALPSASHLLLDVEQSVRESLQARAEREIEIRLQQAIREPVTRLFALVKRFGDRLSAYDPEQPKAHPLHRARIDDLRDLIAVLPALNIGSSPELDAIARDLAWIVEQDVRTIKSDSLIRAEALRRTVEAQGSLEGLLRRGTPSDKAAEAAAEAEELASRLAGLTF